MRNALFWAIEQCVVVFLTDVSGQHVRSIVKGQESILVVVSQFEPCSAYNNFNGLRWILTDIPHGPHQNRSPSN